MIQYYILPDKCVGCIKCIKNCPVDAIKGKLKYIHIIDQEKCTKCGQCLEVCPAKVSAVIKVSGNDMDNLEQLSDIVACVERKKKA